MSDKWLDKVVRDYFRALLAIVLLAGLGLLITSYMFARETLAHDLLRDAGIAAIISFIVTLVIEDYSARRREADIRSGILDSILEKIIDPELWKEIKSDVLQPVICKNWHLQLSVSKGNVLDSTGAGTEHYIAEGTLTYKLTNQTNKELTLALKHELEGDLSGTESGDQPLPRFVQLTVTAATKPTTYDTAALKKYAKDLDLSVPITIPASDSVDIGLTRREIMNIPGARTWYMVWVTLNPAITIQSDLTDVSFDVKAMHPSRSRLENPVPGKAWLFPGVVLPGQGLELARVKITALPIKPAAAAQHEEKKAPRAPGA